MRAEFSQESERPEAPLAGGPSLRIVTLMPRRASCTPVETPKIPAPMMTAEEMVLSVMELAFNQLSYGWG
ncbi:hypothetical protein D3C87_2085340 [compost metagenome]